MGIVIDIMPSCIVGPDERLCKGAFCMPWSIKKSMRSDTYAKEGRKIKRVGKVMQGL